MYLMSDANYFYRDLYSRRLLFLFCCMSLLESVYLIMIGLFECGRRFFFLSNNVVIF